MRRRSDTPALLVALAMLLPSATVLLSQTVVAQSDGAGLCRILTVAEVTEVLGPEPWQIADDGDVPEQCYMHNGKFDDESEALSVRLRPSNEENQQEFRADLMTTPGATELEVDGLPAVLRNGKEITIFFPDPWDMLQMTAIGVEGQDLSDEMTRLAELAVPRYRGGASASQGASPGSPTPSGSVSLGLCEVWPAELLQELLGEPVAIAASDPGAGTCRLQADGSFTGLMAGITRADEVAGPLIDQVRAGLPDAVDLDIEGTPALLVPPTPMTGDAETHARSYLFAFPDAHTMLQLELTAPAAIDAQSALLVLASVALPQLGSVTPAGDASPVPSTAPPSAAARTGLAGLFPAEVGGSPTAIDRVLTGREFLKQIVNYRPMEQRVTKALKRRDRTIGDLSFVLGSTDSGSVIAAFQVEGGPIRPLVNVLLESLAMERTGQDVAADSVAGKDAFEVLGGFLIGGQGVAYPKDEVLWLVFSFGAEQAEIFEKLP